MTAVRIAIAIPLYCSQGSSGKKVVEGDHYPVFTGEERKCREFVTCLWSYNFVRDKTA